MKRHEHQRPRTCRCSVQALEPAEDCPIHSFGEWPPRCEICGQFIPYQFYVPEEEIFTSDEMESYQ